MYCQAQDAISHDPILNDKSSIRSAEKLTAALSDSPKPLHRRLVKGTLDNKLVIHIALRTQKYDMDARDFIQKHPYATIVNIGCGLDNRFERIDNGKIMFYDLDLPEIIDIKKQLFLETSRFRYISRSVFDLSWLDHIPKHDVLFLAEGIFMYCQANDVRSLILALRDTCPGSELIAEVFNSLWLRNGLRHMMNFKMQRELLLGKNAGFRSGIRDSREMESWGKGITFLSDWSYFDSNDPRLGWMRIFRKIELFRKTQWTVHYQLHDPQA